MTEYLELSVPTVADELNRRREKNRRRHINPAIIEKNRRKKRRVARRSSKDRVPKKERKPPVPFLAHVPQLGASGFLSSLMCRNWAPPTPFLAHVPRLRLRVRRNGTHASDEPLAWSWDFPSTELLKTSSGIRGTQDSLSQRDRLRI